MAGAAPGAAAGAARLATPATPAAGRVVQGERARGAAKMLEVLVLQVEDPDCFWVIIKGCSPFLDHEVDYQKLNSAMNGFYNSMCKDTEIKPSVLEEGQVPFPLALRMRDIYILEGEHVLPAMAYTALKIHHSPHRPQGEVARVIALEIGP